MNESPLIFVPKSKQIVTGPSFNLQVPEIYQIEVSSACDLECAFCPRDLPEKRRPKSSEKLIDLDLVEVISKRDLEGSYFIEFQQSGEPTLHKKLKEIISFFKGKVFTGLSTHGGLIHKNLEALLSLDYITISFDAGEEKRYEELRKNANFSKFIENVNLLFKAKGNKRYPIVDLQVIEFGDHEHQVSLAKEMCLKMGWAANVRSVPDSFRGVYDRKNVEVASTEFCLNPWLSVSVQSDGDVVPCCLSFGKEIVYGNLKDSSLRTIWNESPVLKEFRRAHLENNLPDLCTTCYARSPALLHQKLYRSAVQRALTQQ